MPIPLNSATSLPNVDVNAFEEDFGHAVGSFGELSIGELSPAESLLMSTLSQCSTLRRELSGELSGIPAMSPMLYAETVADLMPPPTSSRPVGAGSHTGAFPYNP